MAATRYKVARPLTSEEQRRVLTAVRSGLIADTIFAVFDALLADEGTTYVKSIDVKPWDYAIPTHQTEAILQAFRRQHPTLDGSFLLTWLNVGPSSYDPDHR